MPSPLYVAPSKEQGLQVVGEEIRVLADVSQTGGVEIFLQYGREGSGPPPHSHPWDEAYFMIDGEMDVLLGDRTVVLVPGAFVFVPAGTVHNFRYRAGGGRFVSFNSRAGAAAFFREVQAALPDGKPDLATLIPIAVRNQVIPAGPPPSK